MVLSAARLSEAREHSVAERHVVASLSVRPFLSEEQREAVRHLAGGDGISVVVGLAGAGKSTMLSAARDAWERAGFSVHGAALSGKAAEGLEQSSGIASRTLASWESGWSAGRGELGKSDVFVIDEAGMVSSRQLASFIGAAEKAGAKIVLVGDPEQLQPIQAGAAFRAVAERVGFAELAQVRRQADGWQRQASQEFARHRTEHGLAAYADRGAVRFSETRVEAIDAIVRDVGRDMRERPEGSRLVLAHRRADVRELNAAIREARQAAGELARGEDAGEWRFMTNDGERAFVAGDRVIFLENNRDLGVKNGVLGVVSEVSEGRLSARLDDAEGPGQGREVGVSLAEYAAIDHGYATTIHKSQGATVDRAYVLASEGMDRHLSYVAMTRHREEARLYAGREQFVDLRDLSARLSRSGAKETTLDYAERRGIAAEFGVRSDIAVSRDAQGRAPAADADRETAARDGGRDEARRDSQAQGRDGEKRRRDQRVLIQRRTPPRPRRVGRRSFRRRSSPSTNRRAPRRPARPSSRRRRGAPRKPSASAPKRSDSRSGTAGRGRPRTGGAAAVSQPRTGMVIFESGFCSRRFEKWRMSSGDGKIMEEIGGLPCTPNKRRPLSTRGWRCKRSTPRPSRG